MPVASSLPSDYRAVDSLGYLLRRAHKLSLLLAEQAFDGEDLSLTQWIALIHLRDGIVDTGGGIARCLDHDSGATTRMLDQLEARGLITRNRSESDRRVVNLILTEAGRAAADRLIPPIIDLWEGVLSGFAPGEPELLASLLRRLVTQLGAETAARNLE